MKTRLMIALLACLTAAGALAQNAPSCPKKTVRSCGNAYRVCVSSCAPDASFGQDECRYRCCVDQRGCLIAANCDAPACPG